ncbi:MAG TPA: hydrogenase 3 maturation endopeptidase HyCI [Candidatus Omnitrophota bacterium]|nr:hydrogenase 3 maturation endopeptidase HyCI [Candidatus Omnitrophota bacterium]HPD84911.1 hydrogenase 3 maturation endopeptidase HyCI [Candidatus Omnitrophota bacterium]HRZ03769.1 hydrogenase 3 maturation endopeptidase HyCI [Candidatus Omnitrophota bacterium]
MKNSLKDILKGRIVIVGVGNILRGDDAFGPELIQRLNGKIPAVCIDAGTTPESFVGKIVKGNPDTILIVDAVHLGMAPGACEILGKEEILKSGLTTHDISPKMFLEYLQTQTSAAIYMFGVQPQDIEIGSEMTQSVKKTLEMAEKLIGELTHA